MHAEEECDYDEECEKGSAAHGSHVGNELIIDLSGKHETVCFAGVIKGFARPKNNSYI